MVTEIKNFLSDTEFNNLHDDLLSQDFPWYRSLKVRNAECTEHQMTHLFIDTHSDKEPTKSFRLNSLMPFLKKAEKEFNIQHFLRAKINLYYNTGEQKIGGWHHDWNKKDTDLNVATYYMNTNNGYTQLKDGTKISSQANKIAVFGNVEHTDVTHTDTEERIVIVLGFYT
tara:strand:+ start:2599 stop:3108 length:510 start_codon:yes stop_codon:yes gene_type:complete